LSINYPAKIVMPHMLDKRRGNSTQEYQNTKMILKKTGKHLVITEQTR